MKYPISFIFLILLLGLFIGAVAGSLLHQVFGVAILNRPLIDGGLSIARNFYVLQRLEIQLTPGAILGLLVTIFVIYKKGRN